MSRNVRNLRVALRRRIDLVPKGPGGRPLAEAVPIVFEIALDGTISARAFRHRRWHRRHLAEVFPDLMREHALAPQGGGQVLGVTFPPVTLARCPETLDLFAPGSPARDAKKGPES